ncbi:MAG: hypothetical protein J5671_04010 [Bacteroidaceae bacterium]|nr:hypothetical protein [Bacteroidaceae bacterium]
MKRMFYVLVCVTITLTSCSKSDTTHDELYDAMKSHVYRSEDDVYGFEEITRVVEKCTHLSRDTDVYILQDNMNIKSAIIKRLALVSHTYFLDKGEYNFGFDKNILEIEGKDLKVCPNSKYADLYLSKEEIDYVNKVYYLSIPGQLKTIKDMESRKFNGFRYYYACKFRKKLSDREITKQYVVYKNQNEAFEICELKYDYDLLRLYIRAISNVDMNDPYVISICKEKESERSYDLYRNIFNRLSIDITDDWAIRGL